MAVKTFSVGETLTASDTNTYLANAGLVYVTGGSQSGSGAINVDGCFTTTYNNYRVIMTNISVQTAGRALRLKFRAGGVTNANANYMYAYNGFKANGVANNTAATNQTFAEIGVYIDTTTDTPLGTSTFDVLSPKLSTSRTFATVVANGYEGEWFARSGFFVLNELTAVDGFRIELNSTGNVSFDYRVYGYRQA